MTTGGGGDPLHGLGEGGGVPGGADGGVREGGEVPGVHCTWEDAILREHSNIQVFIL